ncbi:MAG: alpha/beta fold hydrolase [bacterium]|nr:alpha/beta fold hydrolase [bacterium]
MSSCEVVEIITPKRRLLNGLRFGPKTPKRVIIWVHGLGSSAFSKLDIVYKLTDTNTAVITFNNRGHDNISRVIFAGEKRTGKTILGGSAHEVFTECVDDIEGVINFVKRSGAKNIFLAGHSTGCQKSVYWASKKGGRGVKGIILLAPISDYSAEMHLQGKGKIERAAEAARALVARGKKHQLLPDNIWPEHVDAQRFLSLYTPDSTEEMFTYAQPKKTPYIFRAVKLPIFAIFAANDEYADRPAEKIAEWFGRHTRSRKFEMLIVPKAEHSFRKNERVVATAIKNWIKAL